MVLKQLICVCLLLLVLFIQILFLGLFFKLHKHVRKMTAVKCGPFTIIAENLMNDTGKLCNSEPF